MHKVIEMKTKMLCISASLAVFCGVARAQDLVGDWQGALNAGARELRLIVHLEKGNGAEWKATRLASTKVRSGVRDAGGLGDGGGDGCEDQCGGYTGSYAGKLSGDGTCMAAIWTQGNRCRWI
jgi:hypothetical protein